MMIEHIALWTTNLERMKDFYVEFFNGTTVGKYHNRQRGFESYFIRFQSGARLELMRSAEIIPSVGLNRVCLSGYNHIAFSVGSRAAVDIVTKNALFSGCRIVYEPHMTGSGFYESCITDPDGNRIGIME